MKTQTSEALAKLLTDNDIATSRLVREQISDDAEKWLENLNDLASAPDPKISRIAKDLLGEIRRKNAEYDFSLMCFFLQDDGCLESACWALAAALLPDSDLAASKNTLNAWGRALLLKISGSVSPRERMLTLADFLSNELSLRPIPPKKYFLPTDPAPVLLPSIIESRSGWSPALSCLTIFLARRVGMNVVPTSIPAILRHGEIFFDLAHSFRILSAKEYIGLAEKLMHSPSAPPLSSRQLLHLLVRFALHAFETDGQLKNIEKAKNWCEALQPLE